ncbi:AmdA [Stagonosporopsis vannaccii]|nr:AmdA [Stagonosporopsis vannaccii]
MVSRLPSLEPTIPEHASDAARDHRAASRSSETMQPVNQSPWKVSAADHERMCQQVMARAGILPDSFTLPSRQALSRYLEGYYRGLNVHMPFLHTPTLDHGALGLELVLSLAANGAMYRFEKDKSVELYRVAKALIMARLSASRIAVNQPDRASFMRISEDIDMSSSPLSKQPHDPAIFRLLQGLIVLMATTMWSKRALIRESLSMASLIATLVREVGISIPEENLPENLPQDTSWESWTFMEERRRTLFVAYVLFSLQSAAFGVPPMLLNREVCLSLPAPSTSWKASSAKAWADCHKAASCPPRPFQETLEQLLSGADIHLEAPLSAFGNYVLIHGLSIQVYLARNAADPFLRPDSSLSVEFIEKMEAALRAWQKSWEATHESSLDPSSPKGSLGFNCTAILRLVYIRLNVNTGFSRQLSSRDPVDIARAFGDSSIASGLKRSPHLDMAILQCIHALSVPVRVGVAFVARTLTLNWSCQHAVSNLECAFLLAHWLRSLATDIETIGMDSLRQNERKMLKMVISLVREAELADPLNEFSDPASQAWQAAAATASLWAETFRGFHVFDVVQRIGESLSLAAENLEQR